MAGSVNKVIIVGNLGRDPEIRSMQSGSKIATLSVATSESWKDKQTGERKERTEWHRVSIMNANLAEIAERYLKKGSKVYVEGQLKTRKWTDQSGQEKYSTEIVLEQYRGELTILDGRESSGGGGGYEGGWGGSSRNAGSGGFAGRSAGGGAAATGAGGGGWEPPPMSDLDDEIPF